MLTQVIEAMPMPVVLIGADARIAVANRAAHAIFGPVMEGRHHQTVLRQPVLVDLIAALAAGEGAREARFVAAAGEEEATYRVNGTRVQGEGKETGLLLAFEDMSALEQAEEMRRDFVANVSHELRTPLTALTGFIETLRGAARDDAPARERFLGIMEREARRMNRLVSDLLHLSRVESEERVRPTAMIDLGTLVGATAATLRDMALESGVTLEIVGFDGPIRAPGDADQLTQVFTNLIENAVKYGGANRPVTISATRIDRDPVLRGPCVDIAVRDRGEGIDPLHLPRLTERFYRVDTHRSREKGGTGLGLAIVKHIVNRHRGKLRIESAPGHGSVFTVRLPVAA
ncbi:MAG: ATP-binding protein [Paracoccaceae bacterium]